MTDMNIKRDAEVFTPEGKLGSVSHVIVDHETREVTDIVVDADHGEYLVPISAVNLLAGDRIDLSGSAAEFRTLRFDHDQYQSVDDERARAESSGEALHGGAPLVNAAGDAVEVGSTRVAPMHEPATEAMIGRGYHLQRRTGAVVVDEAAAEHHNGAIQSSALREGPVPEVLPPSMDRPAAAPDYRPDSPNAVDETRGSLAP